MARVVNPLMSGSASGSFASLTFQEGGAGAVVRSRGRKLNRQTASVLAVRSFLSWASKEWGKLTTEERFRWEWYSRERNEGRSVGKTSRGGGFDEFVAVNTLRRLIPLSLTTFKIPPPVQATWRFTDFYVQSGLAAGVLKCIFSISGTIGTSDRVQFDISTLRSSNDVNGGGRGFRFAGSAGNWVGNMLITGLNPGGLYVVRARQVTWLGAAGNYVSASGRAKT